MKTPADRLKALRIAAGFRTPTSFADAHQLKAVTYLAHERGADAKGGRGIRRKQAEKYAALFSGRGIRVTPEWIIYGSGEAPPALAGRDLDDPPELAEALSEIKALDVECVRDAAAQILTVMDEEELTDSPANVALAITELAADYTRERRAREAREISLGGKVIPMERLKRRAG